MDTSPTGMRPRGVNRKTRRGSPLASAIVATILLMVAPFPAALADSGGRIIATGGAMSVEGSSGGGIVPWATLAGYGERSEVGGAAWLTQVSPPDFGLRAYGAAIGISNRFGLSIGQQVFDIDKVAPGETLEQDIIGLKVRVAGELIYSRLPQISLGVLFKRNTTFDIPEAVGASDDSGTDFYVAASKLWLAGPFDRTTFVNGTVRATRANQMGLLGFGGDRNDDYRLVGEVSAGLFLNRHWVIGAEYRQKPDNLGFASEDDWFDTFIGWFPNKRVAVVGAWSDLGSIAGFDDQHSFYLSLQLSQ